jgi:hypothetical protein
MALSAAQLAATPGPGQITLTWVYDDPDRPAQLFFELKAEVWAANQNDFSTARKLGEGFTSFTHSGLFVGEEHWYWTRAKDFDGNIGELFPRSSTNGIYGRELIGSLPVPNVSSLSIVKGLGHNVAYWQLTDPNPSKHGSLALDVIELHASMVNNRDLGTTKVDEARDKGIHGAVTGSVMVSIQPDGWCRSHPLRRGDL